MESNQEQAFATAPSWLRQSLDCCCSALALVILSPVLLLIAVAVLLETGRPVLFRQTRVGRGGTTFALLKFRTMIIGAKGLAITARGDSRITRTGRFLRKYKLDELPQLWNVVRGDMSLVGPRPEVPEFVETHSPIWRSVLRVRPGITDPASIAYRNEEELLAQAPDPIPFYREQVLPAKLALNVAYLQKRTLWLDVRVILQTARCAFFPGTWNSKESNI